MWLHWASEYWEAVLNGLILSYQSRHHVIRPPGAPNLPPSFPHTLRLEVSKVGIDRPGGPKLSSDDDGCQE